MAMKPYCNAALAALLLVGTTLAASAQSSTPASERKKPPQAMERTDPLATVGKSGEKDRPPALKEHYSAPSGGMSSGAHEGNESPTKLGNSAGGKNESDSAKRMNLAD